MKRRKKIVLSEENIKLLKRLAEIVDGEKEVAKDPNFALSLLFNRMKERPSGDVIGALLRSLAPTAIEGARERIAQRKAA